MSTIKADGIQASTGTNTDLTLAGKGTGVPDLAAGFKVGGSAGVPTASIRDDAVTTAKIVNDAVTLAKLASGTDGELITWDASGDPAAVAVGTATHVLTSNGAGAAPTFQAAAGGGKVLQIVRTANITETTTSSTTWVDATLTTSITPASSSNTILGFVVVFGFSYTAETDVQFTLFRGAVASGTNIGTGSDTSGGGFSVGTSILAYQPVAGSFVFEDSPASASSVTYSLGMRSRHGATIKKGSGNGENAQLFILEISA